MVTGFWIENAPEGTPNVILWDVTNPNTPEEIVRFQAESTVQFAPDGRSILCAGKVYDLKGNEVREIFDTGGDEGFGHLGSGNQAISQDGKTIVDLSQSGDGRIWDIPSGESTGLLPKHTGYGDQGLKGVAISPLSNNLIVTSSAQGVRLWDRGGNPLDNLVESRDTLYSQVGFSADGTMLAFRQFQGAIRVFETKSWSEIAVCHTPSPGNTLAFAPTDRDLLVAGGDDGVIRGWRTSPVDSVLEHPGRVCTLKFSPDGKTLAVGMEDGEVWFWDVDEQEVQWKLPATRTIFHHQASANSFTTDFSVFSEDGKYVAIIGPEYSITIWNADTHEKVASVRHPGLQFASVAIHENVLFAGDLPRHYEMGGINVWSWDDSGEQPVFVRKLGHPGWGVKSLTISPDGTQLASGQWHDVRIWSRKGLHWLRTLKVSPHEDSTAYSLSYSRDGKLLVVGDGQVGSLIWETKSWQRVWHQSNIDGVVDVAFTPDASRLVVSDTRGNSKLWQLSTQQVLATHNGKCCEFSPDGTILAVGSPGSHWEADRSDKGRVTLHYAPPLNEIEASPAFKQIRIQVDDAD